MSSLKVLFLQKKKLIKMKRKNYKQRTNMERENQCDKASQSLKIQEKHHKMAVSFAPNRWQSYNIEITKNSTERINYDN